MCIYKKNTLCIFIFPMPFSYISVFLKRHNDTNGSMHCGDKMIQFSVVDEKAVIYIHT